MKTAKPKILQIRGIVLARNAVYNLLGLGIPMIIAVLTIPIVIKYIGIERFGILSLAWAVFGYLSIFDIGLGQATTKYVSESLGTGERHQIPKILWASIIFQCLLGIVGTLTLILATPLLTERILNIPIFLQPEAKIVFILVGLSLPVALVSGSFRATLEAAQRFDIVNAVKIPSGAASNLFPLAGALLGFSITGIVLLILCSRLLTLTAWIIFSLIIYPEARKRAPIHMETARLLFKFGGWITISSLTNPFLTYLDRFMVGALLTVTAVSYYTAPYEMTVRLGLLPGSLLMLLFPAFSVLQGQQDEDRVRSLFGRSFKYILTGIGPIVILLIVLAEHILDFWLGSDFAQNSTIVLQILAGGFLLNTLARVAVGFLLGIGRPDIPAKFHVLEVIFYIPLIWILIRKMGIEGAAMAWTFRVFIDFILLYIASYKIGGGVFPNLFHFNLIQIFLTQLYIAILFYLLQSVTSGFAFVAGIIPVFTTYGLMVWIWVLNSAERNSILLNIDSFMKWER